MSAAEPTPPDCAAALADWLHAHRRVFVLTGAGCSTASGIPDYRDASGAWKRAAPVTWQAFLREPATRARYWARSFAGWPHVARALPNATHHALARLDAREGLALLVTQNVDGLHQRAGSREVVDLHGRIDAVRCLDCGVRSPRARLQDQLAARNPQWRHRQAPGAPDGDADIEDTAGFHVPECMACGGMLKPDVVFFGENVPRARVEHAQRALREADAMLVVGSSLMVYSGYRFARMAREAGLPLAILTRGVTRADALATLKLDADCGRTLASALA
ncbi:MAG TPA: NAD-dependent protein deacetylase [Xanthomonadaceae bacterium]|nr:NAD-dependent protein deacetylase [Xanthomonadaceae bacterium]